MSNALMRHFWRHVRGLPKGRRRDEIGQELLKTALGKIGEKALAMAFDRQKQIEDVERALRGQLPSSVLGQMVYQLRDRTRRAELAMINMRRSTNSR